jgi:hypothetical protein
VSLTSDFFDQPLVFAQNHSIAPSHGVEMQTQFSDLQNPGKFLTGAVDYKGDLATKLGTMGHGTSLDEIGYSRVMRGKKVAHIELYDDSRDGALGGNNEGVGVVRTRARFMAFGEARPAFFLPWDDRGFIIKLRIPKKRTGSTDPDMFFTATINGCSVFVQGEPDSPTVYHAGGPTGIKDPNEAARLWRHALINHIKSSRTAQARGVIRAEINKTHYINTPGTKDNKSTPVVDEYELELKRLLEKKGSFRISAVRPWGCVFGVRKNDQWEFYLQENATVSCAYVNKKDVRSVEYAKPVRLSKVYPGGTSAIASMSHLVPVTVS